MRITDFSTRFFNQVFLPIFERLRGRASTDLESCFDNEDDASQKSSFRYDLIANGMSF